MQYLNDFAALMMDRRVSLVSKLFFIMLVGGYILLPIDLIPDILLPLGIVDDGGLLLAAMSMFTRHARKKIERNDPMSEAKNSGAKSDGQGTHSPRAGGNSCGCMSVLGIVGGMIGIIVLAAVALFLAAPAAGLEFITNLFNLPPPTAQTVSTRTIVNNIHPLGQLVTISAEVAKADIAVSISTGVGTFVSSLTDKPVHVQFAEADESLEWPSSCQSEIPSSWSFNEESGEWNKTD